MTLARHGMKYHDVDISTSQLQCTDLFTDLVTDCRDKAGQKFQAHASFSHSSYPMDVDGNVTFKYFKSYYLLFRFYSNWGSYNNWSLALCRRPLEGAPSPSNRRWDPWQRALMRNSLMVINYLMIKIISFNNLMDILNKIISLIKYLRYTNLWQQLWMWDVL